MEMWIVLVENNTTKKTRVRIFRNYADALSYSKLYIRYAYKLTYKYYDYIKGQEIETETVPTVADYETILTSKGHTYTIYQGKYFGELD